MFVLSTLGYAAVVTMGLAMPTPDDQHNVERDKAQRALETYLAKNSLQPHGDLVDLQHKPLLRAYPNCHFFVLRFERYPVETAPPRPLKASNVFAVCGDQITLINDMEHLVKFFADHPPALSGENALPDAARSWLYVVRELHQDGFFKFRRPEVSSESRNAEGVVDVVSQHGDQGRLSVRLELVDGTLRIVDSSAEVSAGIRPRCQATRLLDRDPVIREIMKRDLLVMGRACKPYLDKVRADASSDLREAIDEIWQQIVVEGR